MLAFADIMRELSHFHVTTLLVKTGSEIPDVPHALVRIG